MNNLTKVTLEKRISIILKEFSFRVRKNRNKGECPCYLENKPCHGISNKELNCFFCLCPEYDSDSLIGGCKANNPEGKGKWFEHKDLEHKKVWDCSECCYPHKKENIKKYLNKIFSLY